jgi:cell wall-associated NlpC family hydrolase
MTVMARNDRFGLAQGCGWVPLAHLAPVGVFETDAAAVAERFVGAPYLWGGRDGLGLDCSGLVQQAFLACGRACPRDADQQAGLGAPIAEADLARGDLVFWPGHVVMMVDAERAIHASGWQAVTLIERLADMVARNIAAGVGPPSGYRRV